MSPRTALRLALGALTVALGLAPVVVPSAAHAGQLNLTIGITGAGYVEVVEASLEDGGSPICDQTQNLDHRVTLTCARLRNEEAFEAWAWLRPTTAHSPSGWEFVEWQGCDIVRDNAGAKECGVGSAPFGTTSKSPVAVFRDTEAPTVEHLGASQLTGSQGGFHFNWGTTGAVRQDCRIDDGAWLACSPGTSTTLAEGRHLFSVRAEDASGNHSAVTSIQVSSVDTILYARPAATTNSRTAEFLFGSRPGASYDCSVDGVTVACTDDGSVRLDNVGDGVHRFTVAARDGEWVDTSPVRWTWTVDTTAPDAAITGGPTSGWVVTSTSATFRIGSADPTAQLSCTLDGRARPCAPGSHPVSGLAPGTHELRVTAKDEAGNTDPSPAARHWTVPVPSRSFTRTPGWTTRTVRAAYGGRVLHTTRKGAAVTHTVRNARRLHLVASGGAAHGTVRVYAGTRLVKTVSLRTTRSVTRRVIPVAAFSRPWSGKVRVVVLTSGRTVRLEGLAAPTR